MKSHRFDNWIVWNSVRFASGLFVCQSSVAMGFHHTLFPCKSPFIYKWYWLNSVKQMRIQSNDLWIILKYDFVRVFMEAYCLDLWHISNDYILQAHSVVVCTFFSLVLLFLLCLRNSSIFAFRKSFDSCDISIQQNWSILISIHSINMCINVRCSFAKFYNIDRKLKTTKLTNTMWDANKRQEKKTRNTKTFQKI